MTLPTIHDNGTPARMLAASAEAAYDALQTAYEMLKQTAPNARDYDHPDLRPKIYDAADEHRARLRKLAEVMAELERLIAHCEGVSERRDVVD